MFLSDSQIQQNKERFLSIIESIDREQMRKSELVDKLNGSDFFTAPASAKYHNSVKGGLCAHCLNVYDNLCKLVQMKGLTNVITEDSIKIVALLHDISKMNFYEIGVKNKKVQNPITGNWEWVSEEVYNIKPKTSRFIYGSHEVNSEYIASIYVPLKYEESMAILNHMGGLGYDSAPNVSNDVFERNSLALLLFEADMLATYIDEYE